MAESLPEGAIWLRFDKILEEFGLKRPWLGLERWGGELSQFHHLFVRNPECIQRDNHKRVRAVLIRRLPRVDHKFLIVFQYFIEV